MSQILQSSRSSHEAPDPSGASFGRSAPMAGPEECAAIATRAPEFARHALTREAAVEHLRTILRDMLA